MNAYVGYRGNMTKVAMEHLRPASSLERLTFTDWSEITDEVIAKTTQRPDDPPDGPQLEEPEKGEQVQGDRPEPSPSAGEGVRPQVFAFPFPAQGLLPASVPASPMGTPMPSRRQSQPIEILIWVPPLVNIAVGKM